MKQTNQLLVLIGLVFADFTTAGWSGWASGDAQAAEIRLEEVGGAQCPGREAVQSSLDDSQLKLTFDLSSSSPVATSPEDATARRTCSLHLTLSPGAGQKIVRSVLGFHGDYQLDRMGVGFVSVGQQLADGSATDYLNKTTPSADEARSGCLRFDGPLTDWGSHAYGCGQEVPVTLSVSETARQAHGSGPTSIQGKELSATWELASCSEAPP